MLHGAGENHAEHSTGAAGRRPSGTVSQFWISARNEFQSLIGWGLRCHFTSTVLQRRWKNQRVGWPDAYVYCGFDSDATGDTMAAQMIALHPSLRRLRPSRHDWNDVLESRYA
jgi:hypothetical protein